MPQGHLKPKTRPQVTLTPSPQQQAIIDAARNDSRSIMVTAYAGCAKTSTLEMLAAALPQGKPTLALAFNVKNKKDLEERFPPHFEVKTMNGLGHAAWARAINKRLNLDAQKLAGLITSTLKELKLETDQETWGNLKSIVTLAMQLGLVPKPYPHQGLIEDTKDSWQKIADDAGVDVSETLLDVAKVILKKSIALSFEGTISFDDQIYMSAIYGGIFPRFPVVIVDEAQDLSPLNHIMLKRSAADRLIVVGDPKQAIYSFRGADSASMSKIKNLREQWIELPLSVTFRCPQVIVERSRAHAPGFEAYHTNKVGHFGHLKPWEQPEWTKEDLLAALPHDKCSLAILCRNNAPLLSMAFKLIRAQVGCVMLGRDLGKGLIVLSKKLFPLDDTPLGTCAQATQEWMDSEISLAQANKRESKAEQVRDKGECLLAVCDSSGAKNAGEIRAKLEALFTNEYGKVTLATGHRAKGLEWDVVLHLDPWRVPSKFAKSPSQIEQEHNLRYVIETRSKNILLHANLEDFISA